MNIANQMRYYYGIYFRGHMTDRKISKIQARATSTLLNDPTIGWYTANARHKP